MALMVSLIGFISIRVRNGLATNITVVDLPDFDGGAGVVITGRGAEGVRVGESLSHDLLL